MVISFGHQDMARRTFIRLQLRKSSCDWVQSVLVLFSSSYRQNKKVWIDFIKRFPRYSKVAKNFIRLYLRKSSCVRVEILAVSIPSIHFSNKKTALDYLYPFLSFSVHNFYARTDGRTDRHFSKKFSFFFLIKNIYTCLYLSRLFFKFHPHSDQS